MTRSGLSDSAAASRSRRLVRCSYWAIGGASAPRHGRRGLVLFIVQFLLHLAHSFIHSLNHFPRFRSSCSVDYLGPQTLRLVLPLATMTI